MFLSETIRIRINNLINENNLNGNKLALYSGMNRSNINRFLRRKNKSIKIESITLICRGLNISLKDFFDDEVFKDVDIND